MTDDAGEEQAKLFLLVDAADGFNNLSCLTMLWTICHLWPKMARYAFDAYRYKRRLYVRRAGLVDLVILSIQGVTQDGPLAAAVPHRVRVLRNRLQGTKRGATFAARC